MNRALAFLLTALALLLPGSGALAQVQMSGARVVLTTSWVEEWDPASQRWVRVSDAPATVARASYESAAPLATIITRDGNIAITQTVTEEPVRHSAARPRLGLQSSGIARFGPFRVLDSKHAALVEATDARSPSDFTAMLAAYPTLEVIEFLEAPGTSHDLANLRLGRAIRAAGLATHIPAGGSARSGAVELFLAGTRRTHDPGALFAVHSWRDELGREPADFAADAPENRLYLDYYAEMGMSPQQARAFYAMTNSVPHAGARWLEGAEMATWIAPEGRAPATRSLDPQFVSGLRQALARSGSAIAGGVQALRVPTLTLRFAPAPALSSAAKLAYADLSAHPGAFATAHASAHASAPTTANASAHATTGLLDSWLAFP